MAVNTEMIRLYWRIGRRILDRQRDEGWGAQVIKHLAVDLRTAYPEVKGFSRTNLHYMRAFAAAWPEFVPQAGGQIPWGHIKVLLDGFDDSGTREFYARHVIEQGWSRSVLINMIKGRLHERAGAAPTTFERTVPLEQREAVQQAVRDPYILDWVGGHAHERDLEDRLCAHIVRFLQELGSGFAFMGRQYCLIVGGEEFFVDLLFYNVRLRRYFVIELKATGFTPEHAGKLGFYINVVDAQLRDPDHDEPTIGVLLVAKRNAHVVEFSLDAMSSPLAVGTYDSGGLPPEVRAALPSEDDFATALSGVLDDPGDGHVSSPPDSE
jgi:predicted nuclease of restriction endonuclease-like (RecB) superfamily